MFDRNFSKVWHIGIRGRCFCIKVILILHICIWQFGISWYLKLLLLSLLIVLWDQFNKIHIYYLVYLYYINIFAIKKHNETFNNF